MTTKATAQMGGLTEWLDSQDFYELCQQYRHAQDLLPRAPGLLTAAQAYEELKRQIRERHSALESVRSEARNTALEEAAKACEQVERELHWSTKWCVQAIRALSPARVAEEKDVHDNELRK